MVLKCIHCCQHSSRSALGPALLHPSPTGPCPQAEKKRIWCVMVNYWCVWPKGEVNTRSLSSSDPVRLFLEPTQSHRGSRLTQGCPVSVKVMSGDQTVDGWSFSN